MEQVQAMKISASPEPIAARRRVHRAGGPTGRPHLQTGASRASLKSGDPRWNSRRRRSDASRRYAIRWRRPPSRRRADRGQAQHPRHLGRRHRPVQRQRLQQRHDGLPHAQHRPDRRGGRALHRLVRPAELHRRARRLHHRPVADPHRPDQGRPARRARGHEGRGSDHRRAAAPARLRHRPVRQEPPRRPRRDAADQQRLRAVLRQPLSPQRRGGAREPRLPAEPGVQGAVRPARGDPVAGHARRRPADRGHRPADPGAHGDRGRGGHRRGARLHGQGACRRQAVLPVVELHPHAHLHPPQAGIGGRDRPRDLRRRHGRARRPWSASCSTSSTSSASPTTPS